jgi:hypothetical protein
MYQRSGPWIFAFFMGLHMDIHGLVDGDTSFAMEALV